MEEERSFETAGGGKYPGQITWGKGGGRVTRGEEKKPKRTGMTRHRHQRQERQRNGRRDEDEGVWGGAGQQTPVEGYRLPLLRSRGS